MKILGLEITIAGEHIKEIAELERSVRIRHEHITELNERIRELQNKDSEVVYQDDCSLDFNSLDVFSIERRGGHQTLITWYHETKLQEWTFDCSPRRHLELVKQFEDSIEC